MNKKDLIKELERLGIRDEILRAIEKVDRKNFIPEKFFERAYENHPLPIGLGQTISQPYTVAFMLQELNIKKGDKVLEIGTGSGWNAALISSLVGGKGKVYTIEIIKELAEEAKKKLEKFKNVEVIFGNGSMGLEKYSPYNKIVLTAAASKINEKIKSQIKDGGILIAPVGKFSQEMIKIRRFKNEFVEEKRGEFIFVPLVEKDDKNGTTA